MKKMEEEMQITIESYKQIIDHFEQSDENDTIKIKKEMIEMTAQIDSLNKERQNLQQEKLLRDDEKKTLKKQIEDLQKVIQEQRDEIQL